MDLFKNFRIGPIRGQPNKDNTCGKCYKNKYKTVCENIQEIQLYTGNWNGGVLSCPENCESLNDYKDLTIEIIGYGPTTLLSFDKFLIEDSIKQKLSFHKLKEHDYCHFDLVPISLVKEVLTYLYQPSSKEEQPKTGGNCCVCGGYDKYAPETNGKFFCYLHFKM